MSDEPKPKNQPFTFYWLDGRRTVHYGMSVSHAAQLAGYGISTITKLDFTADGDDHNYVWNAQWGRWVKKAYIPED